MHQGQAFSIMGIFIFLPKQKKRKAKGEDKQAGGECVCFPALQCCAQACLCVQACECNCCLLSLSKLERSEDAQQPMKGKPGDIVRDIGRL